MICWVKKCKRKRFVHDLCIFCYREIYYWFNGGKERSREDWIRARARNEVQKNLPVDELISLVEEDSLVK